MPHGFTTVEKCLFKGNNGGILISEFATGGCYHTYGSSQSINILKSLFIENMNLLSENLIQFNLKTLPSCGKNFIQILDSLFSENRLGYMFKTYKSSIIDVTHSAYGLLIQQVPRQIKISNVYLVTMLE